MLVAVTVANALNRTMANTNWLLASTPPPVSDFLAAATPILPVALSTRFNSGWRHAPLLIIGPNSTDEEGSPAASTTWSTAGSKSR